MDCKGLGMTSTLGLRRSMVEYGRSPDCCGRPDIMEAPPMRETPSLSNSIREPNDALDIVRACAAIFGSNLEDRVGDGGLTANTLSSSARRLWDTIVPHCRIGHGSCVVSLRIKSRKHGQETVGLMINVFSSLSSSTLLEPKLFEEYVRVWDGCLSSSRSPDARDPGRDTSLSLSYGAGDPEHEPDVGKGTE